MWIGFLLIMLRAVCQGQQAVDQPVLLYASGSTLAGAGYSTDSQQIAPQRCYKAEVSSTSNPKVRAEWNSAVLNTQLENILGVSTSYTGGIGLFSGDPKATYLRSVRHNEYTLSIHQYMSFSNTVGVKLQAFGDNFLTDMGKTYYQDGNNKYFGLLCGDSYISSYQQGAILTMGLVVKFKNSQVKEDVIKKLGGSYGSIFNVASNITKLESELTNVGVVKVQAYQIGGEPGELYKILNKDDTHNTYYSLTCRLTAMEDCIKAASGLLDYAKINFTTQFSLENNRGLSPLGIGYTQYTSIDYVGLSAPQSLVTKEVERCRKVLACKLMQNEYYQRKLYPYLNQGYPVKLADVLLDKVRSMKKISDHNVNVLLQTHEGAADSYNFPDKCEETKSKILSLFQPYFPDSSHTMMLKHMKYVLGTQGGVFYNTGGGKPDSWIGVAQLRPNDNFFVQYELLEVKHIEATYDYYHYKTIVKDTSRFGASYHMEFHGNRTTEVSYEGPLKYRKLNSTGEGDVSSEHIQRVSVSPFDLTSEPGCSSRNPSIHSATHQPFHTAIPNNPSNDVQA